MIIISLLNHSQGNDDVELFKENDDDIIQKKWLLNHSLKMIIESFLKNDDDIIFRE